MKTQLDLFTEKPVPPREIDPPLRAAMDVLSRTGGAYYRDGKLVLPMPAQWTKALPTRPGWYLSRDERWNVERHRVILIPATGLIHISGLYNRRDALGFYLHGPDEALRVSVENMGLWFFGPAPDEEG